jgi:inorganic pyrophosphatase
MDDIVDVHVDPTQGSKHKYEYDHRLGAMRLDRRLYSAVSFPADHGLVAGTESADRGAHGRLVLLGPDVPELLGSRRRVFWIRCDKQGESRRAANPSRWPRGDPNFDEVQYLD